MFKKVFCVLGVLIATTLAGQEKNDRWVVYYSDKATTEAFQPYSLIILDPDKHPPLKGLKEQDKTLLGYISLGEVEDKRSWFSAVKKEGILFEENKNWPGSYMVDVRSSKWVKRVIEQIIPQILHKGFDGLFFDTLDNAEYLENKDPRKYAGMVDASVKLVKAIRMHYPHIPLMMNRGLSILPRVADEINNVLLESGITTYNFKTKEYSWQPKELFEKELKALKNGQSINPKLGLYALNYWYPNQTEKIQEIYEISRQNHLDPYVGTIDLDVIVPEPK